MKITVEHVPVTENEVILRCPELDQEMLHVLSLLRSGLQRLCVWNEEHESIILTPDKVIYCESVDDHTFVYAASEVYQTAFSLSELEGRYGGAGFCRISKSSVANLHHIRSLKSLSAGRIEAALETGEKLLVSRHYAPLLRDRLGL